MRNYRKKLSIRSFSVPVLLSILIGLTVSGFFPFPMMLLGSIACPRDGFEATLIVTSYSTVPNNRTAHDMNAANPGLDHFRVDPMCINPSEPVQTREPVRSSAWIYTFLMYFTASLAVSVLVMHIRLRREQNRKSTGKLP